jgi:hypothetical protein
VRLRKAFGAAGRCLPNLRRPNIDWLVDFAVGVHTADEKNEQHAFTAWAHDAALPALTVIQSATEILIGPLALPGQAGCGQCATERRIAAAAAENYVTRSCTPLHLPNDVAAIAGSMLVREVREIIRRGTKNSRLVNHVLAV